MLLSNIICIFAAYESHKGYNSKCTQTFYSTKYKKAMAIIDVVKYQFQQGEIVHRFLSEGLRWGTRVVVYPGQLAYFAKDGQICDEFSEGTYTLDTNNIPVLNHLVNIPYGGDSPFQADVWFINLLSKLDYKWGTETPILIEDPKFGIIVPVRAYGQYGFRITDPRKFIQNLSGNKDSFDGNVLQSYFRGILLSHLTEVLSNKILSGRVSFLEINSHLSEISEHCHKYLTDYFAEYGVELLNFNVISINVPEDDESIQELKKAKSIMARLNITGKDTYRMTRTFDVLETAAANESNGGNLLNAGIGLGAGVTVGQQLLANASTALGEVPPAIHQQIYYLAIGGQQKGPYTLAEVQSLLKQAQITSETLCWKKGMKQWQAIKDFSEFANDNCPPPISNI